MSKRDGNQPGPQSHAEGQQGERTHARLREQISEFRDEAGPAAPDEAPHREGRHRLDENREQHDEADMESEKNRAHQTGRGESYERG